jgi:hypothetical protein
MMPMEPACRAEAMGLLPGTSKGGRDARAPGSVRLDADRRSVRLDADRRSVRLDADRRSARLDVDSVLVSV